MNKQLTRALARMMKKAGMTRSYINGLRKRALALNTNWFYNGTGDQVDPYLGQDQDWKASLLSPQYQAWLKSKPNATTALKQQKLRDLQNYYLLNKLKYAARNVSWLLQLLDMSKQPNATAARNVALTSRKTLQDAAGMNWFGRYVHNRLAGHNLDRMKLLPIYKKDKAGNVVKDPKGNLLLDEAAMLKRKGLIMNNLGYAHFGGMAGGAALGAGLGYALTDNPLLRLALMGAGTYFGGKYGSDVGRYAYNKFGDTGMKTSFGGINAFSDKLGA